MPKFEVIWSDFAEMQLDQIFEYYSRKASIKVASKLVKNLILNHKTFPRIRILEKLKNYYWKEKIPTDLWFIRSIK